MNNDPFGSFVSLISFDQKLIKTETDIKKLELEVSIFQDEIETIKTLLDQLKNSWISTRKIVDLLELKMREFDEKEKEKKNQLEQVQSQKEYTLLKKEIEKIKQEQYHLEPQIIESWNKSESSKKEYEAKKGELENKIVDLENKINHHNDSINSMQTELKELYKERLEKEKGIPQEWIIKYNVMRLRVPNPVVEVQDRSCSACFYHITSQDLIDLKHKKLLECKRCYRFLYIK